ncbi:Transcriptional regulator [Candidatus Magnetomoraceae bacterium gMMP-15]
MLEPMKKPHIELKFFGPMVNKDKAVKKLKNLGFIEISDTIDWRDLFPEYKDEDLPGIALLGARTKENITQKKLSELTGISRSSISAMENGRKPINKKTAKILSKVLNVDYRIFFYNEEGFHNEYAETF